MMRSMRASAKWIMGFVAVFFVGWMIYGVGMGMTGRNQPTTTNAIAKVNGEKIDYQTYLQAIANQQQQDRAQGQAPVTSLSAEQQQRDQVFEQLVEQAVLTQEFQRRDIHVTDQEIVDAARTSPPQEVVDLPQFQTDGKFDLAKYQRFISSSADPQFLMALEARYRDELPRLKLFDRLTVGVYVSDAELWQDFRDANDTVVASIAAFYPRALVPDSAVSVSDSEVSAYYQAHKKDFDQPQTAFMSFIAVSREPNAADTAEARARADSVRAEIVHGGDFAKIAKRESADSVSGQKGGDLGEAKKGDFAPAFEKAALALRPGQLSQPVLTPFGFHIIKLISKQDDSAYHAEHILIPIQPVGDHLTYIESRADTLDLFAAEQEDGSTLDSVAKRLGLHVAMAPPLPEGRQLQLGAHLLGDPGVWAFGPDATVGGTSPVIETTPAYYVFRLDSLHAGGIPPLADIRSEVRAKVFADKMHAQALDIARKLGQQIATGAMTLDQAAAAHHVPVQRVGPFTRVAPPYALRGQPAVVGAAFGLPIGTVGGPIDGGTAVFFVRPDRRVRADSATFAKQADSLRTAAIRNARQQQVELALRSLRDQANVQDLRDEFQKEQRAAAANAKSQPGNRAPSNPVGF